MVDINLTQPMVLRGDSDGNDVGNDNWNSAMFIYLDNSFQVRRSHAQREHMKGKSIKSLVNAILVWMKKRTNQRENCWIDDEGRSEEQILIIHTIEDDKKRRSVINELVVKDFEDALLLRFYKACKDYKTQKDAKKRSLMGSKIISMFIEKGSMHEVKRLDQNIKQSLARTRRFSVGTFDVAIEVTLGILERSGNVLESIRRVSLTSS